MMLQPIRLLGIALTLVLMGGCGASSGQQSVLTPVTTSVSDASPVPADVPTADLLIPVPTGYPIADSTAYPTLAPAATRAHNATATAVAWKNLYDRGPQGDSLEAKDALERWQAAFEAIKSVHGSQNLVYINADGSRQPMPDDQYSSYQSTDEWYSGLDKKDVKQWRYRVAYHSRRGDFTTLYNSEGAYRMWSWLPELYRPWPDTSSSNAYWGDDLSNPLIEFLFPTSVDYSFVGKQELDERKVVELVVKNGTVGPQGIGDTHVYLDEATYLPYRYYIPSYAGRANKEMRPGIERTFVNLEVNKVSDHDFTLEPPIGADTVTVHEWVHGNAYSNTEMPIYNSLQEAQQQVGFALFDLKDGVQGRISTEAFVEKGSKRTPIIALNNRTILEGVYLPIVADSGERFALRYSSKLGEVQITKVDIGGQPAEWHVSVGGSSRLRLERDGTQIEIQSQNMDEAIEIAKGLKRVK